MHHFIAPLLFACAIGGSPVAVAVVIPTVPVGNPGNSADAATGYGSVPYAYNIATYDVTNSQYVEFLNTKDPTGANALGLWNSNMAAFGGIDLLPGNVNGSKYIVLADAQNHPVDFVSWYDAVRFANWLNNGQGSADTETGAYTLEGGTPSPGNGLTITRNAGAKVFLPSEDEWYKAAYYDPITSSYFQYPTSSNTTPTASGPTELANHANYFPGGAGHLTDVGAYTGTISPYGAFDMGGNAYQWNDTLIGGSSRGLRGGSWDNSSDTLLSSFRISDDPADQGGFVVLGFRVASIPEPSSFALAALGLSVLAAGQSRRLAWPPSRAR